MDRVQNLHHTLRIYLFLGLLSLHSMGAELIKIRLGQSDNQKLRIVLDVSEAVQWSMQDQPDPNTLALSVAANTSSANLPKNSKIVKEIQLTDPLILHFYYPITVQKIFSIPASEQNPAYRIVLDTKIDDTVSSLSKPKPKLMKVVTKPKDLRSSREKFGQKIIIVDAGHGGQDPGALGYGKSREKDITFKMARILKKTLERNLAYKVILTRDKDHSMRLRDRFRIAKRSRGDLFISLHADSSESPEAHGLSVYTLSHVASDRDAARLAARENKADLIIGVALESETPEVAGILIDLVKRETMNLSGAFANTLIKTLGKYIDLLPNTHRFADFGVLRSADIPSVLIELGFLSNRTDERLLNSSDYLQKIADGIMEGITVYFEKLEHVH